MLPRPDANALKVSMGYFFGIILFACGNAFAAPGYTDQMYRKALYEVSTSPFYVLFTVHNQRSGIDRHVCISAPFLLGAIHMEHHFDYSTSGSRAALHVALAQPGRRFTFSNRKALRNIETLYNDRILAEVRHALASKSNSELIREGTIHSRHPNYTLHDFFWTRNADRYGSYRDATAHVMLERGILVGIDDTSRVVFAVR